MNPSENPRQHPAEGNVPWDFELVYAEVAAPLRAYLHRSTTKQDADDLFQEALIRFLESPRSKTLSIPESRKFIFRIATNLLRDHWRAQKRSRAFQDKLREWEETKGSVEENINDQVEVEQALRKLTERERAMLWLAHAENYTHREIASALGLRTGSVRVLLFRARKKLASSIQSK